MMLSRPKTHAGYECGPEYELRSGSQELQHNSHHLLQGSLGIGTNMCFLVHMTFLINIVNFSCKLYFNLNCRCKSLLSQHSCGSN